MEADLERLATLLPPAVLDVGASWRPSPTDRTTLLRELLLPLVVEPDWPGPADPLPVGAGWVQPDLTDDDLDTFDRLRQLLAAEEPGFGPERLATAAQEWRLPVLPYRPLPDDRSATTINATSGNPQGDRPPDLDGVRILDLSSLWAGPLCTRLLASAGAAVVKVDPDCRPDGFRDRLALYADLSEGKEILSLDLRRPPERRQFEHLVRTSDVLVESFSRRVLPNLGYDDRTLRSLNSTLIRLSIVGFGTQEPEADWLTYGSGIHAISGMGMLDGRAEACAVAYPDPLTGYRAAAVIGYALGNRSEFQHLEVSLADAGRAVAERTRARQSEILS